MKKRNSYSRIIQGVSTWRTDQGLEKGKMIRLLQTCVEQDITSFDSTDFSGNSVDSTFGTALSESGLSRDKIQLIAKIRNNDNQNLISAVDELLLDLKTDYLDLLLLEYPNHLSELGQDIEILSSQGKILEVGGFDLTEFEMESFNEILPLKANQVRMDFFSEEETIPKSMGSSPENIVKMLFLDGGKTSEETFRKSVYQELASKYGIDNSQLILAWILQHPSNLHPVIPYNEEEAVLKAVEAKKVTLAPTDWQKLNTIFT